jgi:hypothetical protein
MLQSLKDKYKGERCALIANGPSLNKIRWDWQENFKVVMGTSWAVAIRWVSIQPSMHTAVRSCVTTCGPSHTYLHPHPMPSSGACHPVFEQR